MAVGISTTEDSTVEGLVPRFIRPEGRTPSLGCIPVRLAESITEASRKATPRARALVEVFTAEAVAYVVIDQFSDKDVVPWLAKAILVYLHSDPIYYRLG